MALAPHRIDALFTSGDVDARQLAQILVAEGVYPETLENAVETAAEQGKQAYREAQTRYGKLPDSSGSTPAQAARRRFLEAMGFEEELERIAQTYRDEGYVVLAHPGDDQLPEFAKSSVVDLLATQDQEGILIRVKKDRVDLRADPGVAKQAEITNSQPGWRYDLILLGQQNPVQRAARMSGEPTIGQIEQMLDEAEVVIKNGSPRAGFVLAWAGLEAAMRRYAQLSGLDGRIYTQPTVLVREVYGVGGISPDDFHRLEAARHLRTEVVHGLAPSAIESTTVQGVIDTARRLLEEGESSKPMAG